MADIEEGMDAAMSAFGKLGPIDETPLDEEQDHDGGDEPLDGDDPDADDDGQSGDEPDDADEQDDEPEAPAIDAPASWDADAKKVFATLPPEAQRVIAERESHREKAINAKASEAATARKQADGLVSEYSSLHRQFAERLDTYAQAFQPQRPDYGLIATDPQAFAAQLAYFEQATAQREQITQQAAAARQQAEQIETQQMESARREEGQRIVQAIPEMADPAKAKVLWDEYSATARELGYPDELINQARAEDVIGLKMASEWRGKAAKWDALQGQKMAAVRDAKMKPKVSVPGSAPPKGSARAQGFGDAMSKLRKSGDVRDAAKAFAKLG